MKYLVFGAGGFLGSALVRHLQQAGEAVYRVSRTPGEPGRSFAVDITKAEQFGAITIQPDVIINCASALPDAARPYNDPEYLRQLYETNVIGGANIMNWAASHKIGKTINCSTLVVVGKPWPVPLTEQANTFPQGAHVGYSASKLSQELVMSTIAAANQLSLLHLRISALYGPGMQEGGILTKLLQQAKAGETIRLTNAERVSFDFLHVADAAKIIHHLSKADAWPDGCINLASGEEITLLALAQTLCALAGTSAEKIINEEREGVPSRAKVDTSLLEKYIAGTGITIRPFAEKVKSMIND